MFIEMLLKTIPRSWRAGVALFVMLVALGRGLSTIQALLLPGKDEGLFIGLLSLVIGIGAAIAFYYFQSVDGSPRKYHELDTLNKHHMDQRYKQAKATPVFSSHEGEMGTRKDPKVAKQLEK